MTEAEGEEYVTQLAEEERVSEGVLRAVAAVSNRPLLELPPLHESVDADALDRLFDPAPVNGRLQFEYAGYGVTVEPERIRVHERR